MHGSPNNIVYFLGGTKGSALENAAITSDKREKISTTMSIPIGIMKVGSFFIMRTLSC
jgi:hypothetical protein